MPPLCICATSELKRSGHTVWEALAVSEVLYLCEQQNIDVVVIAPDVENVAAVEVQMRRMTLTLKPGGERRYMAIGAAYSVPISALHPAAARIGSQLQRTDILGNLAEGG